MSDDWQQRQEATWRAQEEAGAENRARVEAFQNAGRYPYWQERQYDISHLPRGPGLNPVAVLALISAFFFAPLAIVLGIIGRRQTARTGQNGHGMATAGLVLGIIGIAVPFIVLMAISIS